MSETEEFNVEHLRNVASFGNFSPDQMEVVEEAVEEIEKLRKEVKEFESLAFCGFHVR